MTDSTSLALAMLAWGAVVWVAIGIVTGLYALYRIYRARKGF